MQNEKMDLISIDNEPEIIVPEKIDVTKITGTNVRETRVVGTFDVCVEIPWLFDGAEHFTATPSDATEHGSYIYKRIMDGSFGKIEKYVVTKTEALDKLKVAAQAVIDAQAQVLTFDNGADILMRAGYPNPYQLIAREFSGWEASIWQAFDKLANDAKAKIPYVEAFVATLPAYPTLESK